MKKYSKILLFVITLLLLGMSCERRYRFEDGKISGVNTIENLDKAASFSFAIMSDNKGESPSSRDEFLNMVQVILNYTFSESLCVKLNKFELI